MLPLEHFNDPFNDQVDKGVVEMINSEQYECAQSFMHGIIGSELLFRLFKMGLKVMSEFLFHPFPDSQIGKFLFHNYPDLGNHRKFQEELIVVKILFNNLERVSNEVCKLFPGQQAVPVPVKKGGYLLITDPNDLLDQLLFASDIVVE